MTTVVHKTVNTGKTSIPFRASSSRPILALITLQQAELLRLWNRNCEQSHKLSETSEIPRSVPGTAKL
ncbi:hypothetical protein GIX45_20265 [Erwinia sp. CPCC 100877]|nr:hypothetical protein [Erwinia sp. CPCC 100877]